MWVTGTYDPVTSQTFWGTGNPVPMFDPFYRPGDNLSTNSAISYNPDNGKHELVASSSRPATCGIMTRSAPTS